MPTVARIIRRRRQRKARQAAAQRRSAFWLALITGAPSLLLSLPFIAAIGLAFWLYIQAASYFPTVDALMADAASREPTRFYARDDQTLLHALGDSRAIEQRWSAIETLPDALPDALIALEEPNFHSSQSFDPLATLLDIWRYILGLPLTEDRGIALNLTRDALLPIARESALDQRLLELAFVAESRRRLSAEELLEWRLNTMYYGADAFGIEAAAQSAFGESAVALDLARSSLLLSLSAHPALDHAQNPRQLRQIQADLLDAMLDLGAISKAEYDLASRATPQFAAPAMRDASQPADFIAYARSQAAQILRELGYDGDRALAGGGFRVATSLDYDLYLQSECLGRAHLSGAIDVKTLDGGECAAAAVLESLPAIAPGSTAMALLDATTGEILSMAGGALDHAKQPGALLQPFVYLEGFLRRIVTPASMVYDLPQVYPGAAEGLIYAPANQDGRYRGPLNLRDAMAAALTAPAAQVAEGVGMSQVIRTARRLGFSHLDESRAALDLLERGGAASVLDAAYAYSVMSNMGVMRGLPAADQSPGDRPRDPVAVLRIRDADGATLWQYDVAASNATALIEPSLAYMGNHILSDADARQRTLDLAAVDQRRGTAFIEGVSADGRDSWSVAYTPHLTLAAHLGSADEEPTEQARAESAAAWLALLDAYQTRESLAAEDWTQPPDIEEFIVCDISGMLPPAAGHCPTRLEILPAGSPLSDDIYWRRVELNSLTNQLATVSTPDNLRRSQVFFVPPDEVMDWWIANDKPLPPSEYTAAASAPTRPAQLIKPDHFAYVAGAVQISGRVNQAGAVNLRLEYGEGVNPGKWIEIAREDERQAPLELSATWDASALEGIITVRLSAEFADGSSAGDTRQFTLDNSPPLVRLRESENRETIAFPAQRVIALLADARDNLAVDRVEFYRDADLLGVDGDFPYGIEYAIEDEGALDFRAIAFDHVGNSAAASLRIRVISPASR